VSEQPQSVFLPGLGFRSARGMGLAAPLTFTRENDQGVRVMYLASTDRGTELAFEVRDKDREGACMVGPVDNVWMRSIEIRLRDSAGELIPRSQRLGQSFAMGRHEYGFYRADVPFEPLPVDSRRVTLEIRGPLGEWDIALDLVPLMQAAAVFQTPIGAEQERRGISMKILGMAITDSSTVLEIEASALPPVRILAIGARVIRNDDDRLVLVDQHGRRLEEIPSSELSRPDRVDGSHTVAMFPALPDDAQSLTLVVPGVVIKEGDETLELELPVTEPTEARFGPYPVRIGSARISDEVRPGPGEPPRHGVEMRFGSAGWFDDGRVLYPERIRVGEIERFCGWGRGRDPEFLTLNVELPEGTSARSVTLVQPVVKVRGPWEIAFSRP
jgi:hypothetical protein